MSIANDGKFALTFLSVVFFLFPLILPSCRRAVSSFPFLFFFSLSTCLPFRSPPSYYPQSGSAKMVYTIDGNVSQEYDLRYFPFDIDDYRLMIVAGNNSKEVRLFWQTNRDLVQVTPKYLNRQLTEYNLVADLNQLTRLPYIESNNLWGKYNGVQFIFHLKRNTRYYLVKILLIVFFLNVISWASYFMVNDPRVVEEEILSSPAPSSVADGSGVLLRQRQRFLKGGKGNTVGEDTIYMHMGAERFAERISLLAEILLACVAFQYLMDESIPKLGFLTTIDELLMSSYIVMFLMALQSFIILRMCRQERNEMAVSIDYWCSVTTPIFYCLLQSFHMIRAMRDRGKKIKTAIEKAGVEGSLVREMYSMYSPSVFFFFLALIYR